MKRSFRKLLVPAVILCLSTIARGDLAGDVGALLGEKELARAQVGLQVVQLGAAADKARVVLTHNASVPLVPASNMKIVTTSAALDILGGDFKFRTMLVRRGEDVIIVGDGDPTFGDYELLKKAGWDVTTVFQHWAAVLKKANITSVRDVLVDDSVFDEVFTHPNWEDRHIHRRYAAQVGGINLNANCVDFFLQPAGIGRVVGYRMNPNTSYITLTNRCITDRENATAISRPVGRNEITLSGKSPGSGDVPVSIAVHDPPLYAGMVMAETFIAAGIPVKGKIARDRTVRAKVTQKQPEAGLSVLAIHETPLIQVVIRANKDSMNVYAEAMCKRNGFAATGQSGSWTNGTAAAASLLKRLGVDEKEFRFDDGCGLSKENAVSANAMTCLLIHNFHSKYAQPFIDSLAVAGQDGTLEKRFEGSDLRGRVMAKTGFISGVSCLSGYLKTRDDKWFAFSILMNNCHDTWKMKQTQEAILKAVDRAAK